MAGDLIHPWRDREWPERPVGGDIVRSASIATLPEKFEVDPHLPVVSQDAAGKPIVIPKGRCVALGAGVDQNFDRRRMPLTIADGTNKPLGVCLKPVRRPPPGQLEETGPVVGRHCEIEVPYLANDANVFGALTGNDLIVPGPVGRPARYVARDVHFAVHSGDGTATAFAMAEAKYEKLAPVAGDVVVLVNGSAADLAAEPFTWDATAGNWVVNLAAAPAAGASVVVIYRYGHKADQVVGEVVAIQTRPAGGWLGWLEYVTIEFGEIFPQIPGLRPAALGRATDEAATVVAGTDGLVWQVANVPIWPEDVVIVKVDGTELARRKDGQGEKYIVDFERGRILFARDAGVTETSSVTVTYSYIQDWGLGVYGAPRGIPGLTDGRASGLGAGTPPELDVAGSVGSLRIWVK